VTADPLTIIVIGALAVLAVVVIYIIRLTTKLNRLLRGKNARTLEDTIISLADEIDRLKNDNETLAQGIIQAHRKLKRSIQKVHTIRFNPFRDQGGNQSFATALLDEEGNGVVISSLYAREKVSVYAKPLIKNQSAYELSAEEKEAIAKANIRQ
jgi:hypothetical protein